MPEPETIDWGHAETWYDEHAEDFEMATLELGITPLLEIFSRELPAGGRVLDAGCGAGRDTRWLLDQGFNVGAFDISRAMVQATWDNTGRKVAPRRLDFRDYEDPPGSWDGIWALASLLHLPKADMPDCLARLCTSLTPTGCLAFSVKLGTGEGIDELGRPMAFYEPEEITEITAAALGIGQINSAIKKAPSSSGEIHWINVLAERMPGATS